MRSIKKSWEVRLAGYVPCVLGTTSCTVLLLLLGLFLFASLPGDLMEITSFQEALSFLRTNLPVIAVCACAIAHLIWSFVFVLKIEAMESRSRIRGWVVHLLLGAPIPLLIISFFGFFAAILAIPEILAGLLSVTGLGISIVSHRQQMADDALPGS